LVERYGFAGYAAGGYGSLNGTRANQMNWQIDGVDNNDCGTTSRRLTKAASPVSLELCCRSMRSISSTVQTQSSPESGREPRSTVDLALKSGGNAIMARCTIFTANEAFAAASLLSLQRKRSQLQLRILGRRADP